jgi:2-polyprenyl-3-methyl-5-hydroxy-6-metoxy-1,4-benzoquinol methylase
LKLSNKPIGIDPIVHKDVDKSIDFRDQDIFKFFKVNNYKFDLIMIKQTLHFFNKNKRKELIKTCRNNLKKNGVLIILSLNTSKNEIPCFSLMKKKLNRGLARDLIMLNSVNKILKNTKIDKFKYEVSITKDKYIKMLKQRYISCLVNLTKDQIKKGINEIKSNYSNRILFNDILICIKYKCS